MTDTAEATDAPSSDAMASEGAQEGTPDPTAPPGPRRGLEPYTLAARAVHLGGRLHVRDLPGYAPVSMSPFTVPGRAGGFFVVFRFGALVAIGASDHEAEQVLDQVRLLVENPETTHGEERAAVAVNAGLTEGVGPDGRLQIRRLDVGRAQVLANVLAKSAVLGHFEERAMAVFDRVELMATHLRGAEAPASDKELLREIGETLLMRTSMVGRVEVSEKPEITWDHPELDRLYERLAFEFELGDRDRALSRKLELISDVAETYLELLHTRKSIRLEWYIIALIAFEIVFVLWELL